jgi:hypothetical protein
MAVMIGDWFGILEFLHYGTVPVPVLLRDIHWFMLPGHTWSAGIVMRDGGTLEKGFSY